MINIVHLHIFTCCLIENIMLLYKKLRKTVTGKAGRTRIVEYLFDIE